MKRFVNLLSGLNSDELREFVWFLQHPNAATFANPRKINRDLEELILLKLSESIHKKQSGKAVFLVDKVELWSSLMGERPFERKAFSNLFTPFVLILEAFLMQKYLQPVGRYQRMYAVLRFSRERKIQGELETVVRQILSTNCSGSYFSLRDLETWCDIWRELQNVKTRTPDCCKKTFGNVDCMSQVVAFESAREALRKEQWTLLHGTDWGDEETKAGIPNRLYDSLVQFRTWKDCEKGGWEKGVETFGNIAKEFTNPGFPIHSEVAFSLYSALFRELLVLHHSFPGSPEVANCLIKCYALGFENGLLAQEGRIPVQHFVNFITLTCKSNDLKSAQHILKMKDGLFDKAFHAENTRLFGEAMVLFCQGEFSRSRSAILHYRPVGKRRMGWYILALKLAVELEDSEFSELHGAFGKWLRSKTAKSLFPKVRLSREKERLSILNQLFSSRNLSPSAKQQVIEKIEALNFDAEWMLEKAK